MPYVIFKIKFPRKNYVKDLVKDFKYRNKSAFLSVNANFEYNT